MGNEEQNLKNYEKLKNRVISLVEDYKKTKSEDIKKELFNILESTCGSKINIRKPSYWEEGREFDRYKFLPNMLTSIYKTERKHTRIRFNELYELAEIIFDETSV
jgi:hypothetical protein